MIEDGFLEDWLDHILAENENAEISAGGNKTPVRDLIPSLYGIDSKKAVALLLMTPEEKEILGMIERHRLSFGDALTERQAYERLLKSPPSFGCEACRYKDIANDYCCICPKNDWKMTC